MSNVIRFGRKIALPSTIQIKHELRLMAAVDDIEKAGLWDGSASEPTDAALKIVAGDLSRVHGISLDRATMIVDRFGDNHHTLDVAASTMGRAMPTGADHA